MKSRVPFLKLTVAIMALALAFGCAKKKRSPRVAPAAPVPQETKPVLQDPKPLASPSPQTSTPKVALPKSIVATLNEKSLSFSEPVSIVFERYGYVLWDHIYVFKKSYLGPKDDRATFWWQAGDDVSWSTPWTVISFNAENGQVLGGAKAGEGQVIGRFLVQNDRYLIELSVSYSVNKKEQQLSFTESVTAPPATSDCNFAVKSLGLCDLYNGIYAVLAGIDYRAFGEVAPGVAADVVSVGTAVKLVKSAWFFKARVDSIRDEYLVPLIKSIAQLKAMKTADQKNRTAYLQQARQTYSNLVITSVDTILKTQKMMPEALGSLGGTAIGSVLAYLNMNSAADYAIAIGNPPWFRELVSPVIREVGQLALDLVINGSGTPLQTRIDRFLAMEDKLKETVRRICASSPTNAQSECAAAWNL